MNPTDNQPEQKSALAEREEAILAFWKENKVFEKSLEKTSGKDEFVFYDGPPFATGLPHYGSLLSSVAKDLFGRYKTMRGYYVRRRWGWDTHGLPIENGVEKKLNFTDKKDIEKIGIQKFNETCSSVVLEYADHWERYVDRTGRWVEYKNAYKTMDASYTESIWWALKTMHEKGLIYEGRKVLMYCPHCETPLAKAEIAMDNSYKDVKDITVTGKFKSKAEENTYFLAWTTTPWTLPGNVGLAVGPDIDYAYVNYEGADYIVAKELVESVFAEKEHTVGKMVKGSDLVDMEYEPLFDMPAMAATGKKAWYVMPADFVTTTDGTGIVHTAVIYGEDDYQLGLKFDLPMVPMLGTSGKFLEVAPEFLHDVYFKNADLEVLKDLKNRDLLFSKRSYTHSYPHCYRCDTPLIYNALSSWFIDVQKIKPRLLELNNDINWHPDYLQQGRMKHILETAPDWNFSRNRFWAAPIPFFKTTQTGELTVLGSLADLKKHVKRSGNTYTTMRHGESVSNIGHMVSVVAGGQSDTLTDKGREQVAGALSELKEKNVDLIVVSPFTRTQQTAEIVREGLGLATHQVLVDERFAEWNIGAQHEGEKWTAYQEGVEVNDNWYDHTEESGESLRDMQSRSAAGLFDLESKYQNKNILIIAHNGLLKSLHLNAATPAREHAQAGYAKFERFENVQIDNLDFVPFSHNAKFELDYHRPYIDQLEYVDDQGREMVRIPEVVDCWLESGSMPFAEYHYPFQNKEQFESRFPGDYVAEYIGQVRAWFYYMQVVSTALFDNIPFKNVITTGNIQAADGAKMSKSKGNFTDPWANFNKMGADAMRMYMLASPVMRAEDLAFSDEGYEEVVKRLINMLSNVVRFYEIFTKDAVPAVTADSELSHPLDQWIRTRAHQVANTVTEELDGFNTVKAARPIREFVQDLSQWYVRRSRDRFKSDDASDREQAIGTTLYVLQLLAKVMAPFMPFAAEDMWQKLKSEADVLSVHLCDWPEVSAVTDAEIAELESMQILRDTVTAALELRDRANIKVRQPLQSVTLKRWIHDVSLLDILQGEMNVKEVLVDEGIAEELMLDTEITPALQKEGYQREILRQVQSLRKAKGLVPSDQVEVLADQNETLKELIESMREQLQSVAGVSAVEYGTQPDDAETRGVKIDGEKLLLSLK